MIPFQGSYTRQQFFQGIRLASLPTRRALVLRGIGGLIALAALAAAVVSAISGAELGIPRLLRTGFVALFLLFWAVSPFIQNWRLATNQWRRSGGRISLKGTITSEGIVSNALGPDVLEKWDSFMRAHARPEIVVLLGADGLATILPRAFFATEADWTSFQQMVSFNVVTPS